MSDAQSVEEKLRRENDARAMAEVTTPPPTNTKWDDSAYALRSQGNDAATLQGEDILPDQPVSKDQFVQALSISGLISNEELRSIDDSLPPDERPADARGLRELLIRKKRLTEYQAAQLSLGQTRGLVFGNYVVLDKLGEGGMGVVFKAHHRRMKRTVALKVLPSTLTNSPDAIARFHREVEAAAKLTHPNIAAAYDADEASGVHFLVMEYVDAANLSQTVKQNGPLPLGAALNYVLQAAKGLNHAHLRGVVHRDIKPGNLLLNTQGTLKILDMGLARFDAAPGEEDPQQAELTQSGRVMGTVDYMAPEQALDAKHADQRADIYSLGCTLWYLLTGRAISPDGTLTQKLIWHQTSPPPTLSESCPAVGPRLEAVYEKIMAKKPADRQQTMGELIGELEACLSELSPEDAATAATGFNCGLVSEATLNQIRTGQATVVERPTLTQHGALAQTMPGSLGSPPRSRWPLALAALLVLGAGGGAAAFFLNNANTPEPPPKDPQIHLTISHPGAELFLNDQKIAINHFKTDADEQHRCLPAKVGQKYRIRVAKAGFGEFVKDVEVKSPEHVSFTVDLKAVTGPVVPPVALPQEKFLRWVFVQRGSATLVTGKNGETVDVTRSGEIPQAAYTVKVVKLDDAKLTDADYVMLADATGVESLSLKGANLTLAGAEQLAKLTTLWSIDLSQAKLSPGALAKFGTLNALRDLNLHKTNVTDQDLTALRELPKLEHLYLTDTGVTDAALKSLSAHGELRQIALNGTKVTATGIDGLKDALPKLKIAWDPPDVDREIARNLLAGGALLTLTLDGGNGVIEVRKAADLPEPRFHIKGVNFANQAAVDDAVLTQLAGLTQLQSLGLEGTGVTAQGIGRLATMPTLKTIELGTLQIADAAVDALKLALPGADVRWNPNNERQTAEWILQQKGVVGVITPDGEQVNKVSTVAGLPAGRFQIREARLDGVTLTDADLKRFKGLTRLETLGLMNTAIGDAGVQELASCSGLRDLWLSDTKVTDAGLPIIAKLPSLRSLLLAGLPITDRGLEQLKQRQLTHLSLAKTQVTDEALLQLSGVPTLTWLSLAGTAITDASLPHLTRLKGLKELYVENSKLTDAGLEELGAALPQAKVLGNPLDRQRLALRMILSLGGAATTDKGEIRKTNELPRVPCQLVKIDLGDLTKVANEHLPALAACTIVAELDLTGAQINDEGLKSLAGLTNLVRLSLANTRITDAGLAQLRNCVKLQSLSLAGTRINGEGFAQWSDPAALETLVLDTAKVSDRGAANLAAFVNLKTLNLNNNSALTDKSVNSLAGLEKLQVLSLRGSQVGDAALAQVAKLAQLTHIDLGNTAITDAGVSQLKSLANLKSVSLYGNVAVGDNSLSALAGIKTLRAVDVARTKVTDGGVTTLKQTLPDARVTKSENRADPNNPPLDDGGAGGGFRSFGPRVDR